MESRAGKAGLLRMIRNFVDAEAVALDNQSFRFKVSRHG
jgi:hypothetical protein